MMNVQPDTFTAEQKSTLNYYETNTKLYANRTLQADLSELYEPFLGQLKSGARILDVGCGAGRDLKAFAERGFRPYGIDISPALVRLANLHSNVPTSVKRIEDIDYINEFDAVWACASLLHLPQAKLADALARLKNSLLPSGIFLLSMQKGSGEAVTSDGRLFARYSEEELRLKVEQSGFEILRLWLTKDTLSDRSGLRWINILAKKK